MDGDSNTVINNGTLNGGIEYDYNADGTYDSLQPAINIEGNKSQLTNSGTINGVVYFEGDNNSLIMTASVINGDIEFESDDSTLLNNTITASGGRINGNIYQANQIDATGQVTLTGDIEADVEASIYHDVSVVESDVSSETMFSVSLHMLERQGVTSRNASYLQGRFAIFRNAAAEPAAFQ